MVYRTFEEGTPYTQESGPDCKFLTILGKCEVGDMGAGLIKMKGPSWNKPAAHDSWQQFYIVLKGSGLMRIGDDKFPVAARSVIMIPFNTVHAMEVRENEEIEYMYVNQYINASPVGDRLPCATAKGITTVAPHTQPKD